ncbi:MAG: MFS transporter [Muribaculaceae bacterium]|nr:MFS transporter [Muribaculaceae bacterium]
MQPSLRFRLSALYALQFAIWGCYLSCFGQLLGASGLGTHIQWFYAAVGIVSLFTPVVLGYVSDRFIPSVRLLGLCHLGASVMMAAAWAYSATHPAMEFGTFFALYLGFLALYMPTMALSNATAFGIMKSRGLRPVDHFPSIRIWGTIGFVGAMWFVNSAYLTGGSFGFTLNDADPAARFRFQYTSMQLLCAAVLGLVTAIYTLTLPRTETMIPAAPGDRRPAVFRSFTLLRNANVRRFLIIAVFAGVCLQISNGYAIPYINHFMADGTFAGSLAAGNATMLFSLSNISEALCVLLVGVSLKRFGIRIVLFLALLAWCLRFLLLGLGNPGYGLWMLVGSMIVYGIAFNFFNIAGNIYMDQMSDATNRGFGQGLLMMVSNGIGASTGMIAAGAVVNHYCHWQPVTLASGSTMPLFMGDWTAPWLIFAGYSLVVSILALAIIRTKAQ